MNKKKFLSMAIAGALMVSAATAAYANPVTDTDDPAYVELTAVADNAKAKGEAISPAELEKLAVPKADVKLVDKKADAATVALYRYLSAVPKAGKVIYGHENDAHHKMFRPAGGSESDTKDVTGSLSGIVGFDALSFVGDEQRLDDCEWNTGKTYVDKMVEITRKAAGEGAIITMSMHMPNFDLVERRAAVTGSTPENRDHYMNYTTHISEGNVVHRILPGGDLNASYNGYLDRVAEYGNRMAEDGIPVLFRPLHEHNGYWFWWGKEHSSEKDFQQLWEYTVKYLRDTKGVHNFLYVYSPNGHFKTEADYLDRYPGDKWVDIMGVDTYDDDQTGQWYTDLCGDLDVMQQVSEKHGKLMTITEVGVRRGGSLAVTGNVDKQWFSKVAKIAVDHKVPYFMTWSNFEKLTNNFFAPYMVSKNRGHEMINEFVDFYNEPETLFADGVNWQSLKK